jgi:hypothetical protein
MSSATGRSRGHLTLQLLTAIDSLCDDPAWDAIVEHQQDPQDRAPDPNGAQRLLVKRARLAALRKRVAQEIDL